MEEYSQAQLLAQDILVVGCAVVVVLAMVLFLVALAKDMMDEFF